MEDKKNHPSLPSNYVTLAQLQQRWLKQQHQINQNDNQTQQQQEEEEQEQHPMRNLKRQDPHQRGDRAVVVPRNGTASRSAAGSYRARGKQYRPKNRNDSGTDGRSIEVASENHRKSEADAGIGDENADLNGKGNKSKKKKKKMKNGKGKPSVEEKEERGASEDALAQGNKEGEDPETEKTTIENELNDEKQSGDSMIAEEVEQKFRGLSMNSGNGKQNGRLRRVNDGFRPWQSRMNNYGGRGYGYGYGYGHGHGDGHGHFGGGFRRQHYEVEKRRIDKMVWVRKDGNVGGIET